MTNLTQRKAELNRQLNNAVEKKFYNLQRRIKARIFELTVIMSGEEDLNTCLEYLRTQYFLKTSKGLLNSASILSARIDEIERYFEGI
jgi:hypothetical protein